MVRQENLSIYPNFSLSTIDDWGREASSQHPTASALFPPPLVPPPPPPYPQVIWWQDFPKRAEGPDLASIFPAAGSLAPKVIF